MFVVVIFRVYELVKVLIFAATRCKHSINLIINPDLVSSQQHMTVCMNCV
jgi:hypothetical protein